MSKRVDGIVRYHRMLALALLALAACSGGETTAPDTTTSSSTGGPAPEPPVDHAATDACTVFPQDGCAADHTCVVATAPPARPPRAPRARTATAGLASSASTTAPPW